MEIGSRDLYAMAGTMTEDMALAVTDALLNDALCIYKATGLLNADLKGENCMYNTTNEGLRVFFIDLGAFSVEWSPAKGGTPIAWPWPVGQAHERDNTYVPFVTQDLFLFGLGIMMCEFVMSKEDSDEKLLGKDDPSQWFQEWVEDDDSFLSLLFRQKAACLLGRLPADAVGTPEWRSAFRPWPVTPMLTLERALVMLRVKEGAVEDENKRQKGV
jgi:hypothetical protein